MSTSGRKNIAAKFQGPSERHQHNEHHVWEDLIAREAGVICNVKVTENEIKICTNNYASYILARSVVSKRSGLPIIQG